MTHVTLETIELGPALNVRHHQGGKLSAFCGRHLRRKRLGQIQLSDLG